MLEKTLIYKNMPVTISAYKKADDGFVLIEFSPDKIEHYEILSEDCTAIVLGSGARISVTMPLQELKEGIDEKKLADADGKIDLTRLSGPDYVACLKKKTDQQAAAESDQQKKQPMKSEDDIGVLSEDGIFFGTFTYLGKTFNAYAAPEDLNDDKGRRLHASFNRAQEQLAQKRNWYGFDGADHKGENEILLALASGAYNGEWFIPTSKMLSEDSQNLFKARRRGAFAKTFKKGFFGSDFYWSSTRQPENPKKIKKTLFHSVRVTDEWTSESKDYIACRPVRLVPVSPNSGGV